jgi:hypothetical protein
MVGIAVTWNLIIREIPIRKRSWFLYQLEIKTADGGTTVINSDGTWKSSMAGAIKKSDIYNGETLDARLISSSVNLT